MGSPTTSKIRTMNMLQKGKLCEVLGPLVVLILLNHFVVTLDGSWTREVSWTPIYVDTTSKLLIHFLLCLLLVGRSGQATQEDYYYYIIYDSLYKT